MPARRGLSHAFLADLQSGLLAPLRARVVQDTTLCLELRENYVNIYYRGGCLMKLTQSSDGYSAVFDRNYSKITGPSFSIPNSIIRSKDDVDGWLMVFPWFKQAIDLFGPGEEREAQQQLLRDNNSGSCARGTDYYICDIEYANPHGRFDIVAVHWPSTSRDRKNAEGRRLVLGEVKFGDGALDGPAGLHAHINDVNAFLTTPENLTRLRSEALLVFNQKRALGLIDCGKDLTSISSEPPILLLVLINHDPDSPLLRKLLLSLPPSPHAELRIATGSLLGYGLHDPAIFTVEQALSRFETCIR